VKIGIQRVSYLLTRIFTVVILLCLQVNLASSEELVTFYHNDHLGSPIAATDAQGYLLWQEDFRPYGEKLYNENTSNRVGYTGKEDDSETGLTYMGARYYHPVVGRFMAIDPVGFVETNPTSFNRYAYANNNPYKYIDPNGEYADLAIEAVSLGLGISNFTQNVQNGNYGHAAVDAVGIAVDSVLAAIPGVPGVAGIAINSSKGVTKGLVDTNTLRFTQDSIGSKFSDGRSVQGLIDGLKSGKVSPNDLPPIRTFQKDGLTFTLDNRRLFAAHQAGVQVKTVPATAAEIAKELPRKFTTPNNGTIIGIRGALE
jgi:RHS repeat-associated protein